MRRVDEQVPVGRAARTVVVGLADPRVARRFFHVRGFVDHHRRVPGADAVRRFAGSVGRLDHGGAAGGDRQVAARHQVVRQRNARSFDDLEQVFRRAEFLQGGAHHADGFDRRVPARRVRREDDRVLALDRVDGDADRCDVGTGDRNERRDHAGRLRVLDEAADGVLFDHAHALLAQRVAENALHFRPARRLAAPHAAFIDAHIREPRRGRFRFPPAHAIARHSRSTLAWS